MELTVETRALRFREEFANARGARREERVVRVAVEHDGVRGCGEATPVTYRGETAEQLAEVIADQADEVARLDPFSVDAALARLHGTGAPPAAACAFEAAVHDWIGRRVGLPLWRLWGLRDDAPPSSYTVSIDTVAGTVDRVRRHNGFRVMKVKLGDEHDAERLEAVRAATEAAIRVDVNEGWTLEQARELMPLLVECGVEFLEQPFPADDPDSYRALRELQPRVPVVLDESCQGLDSVPATAPLCEGVSVKLEKAGGLRQALRVIAAARALGLRVMLSCMLQTQLGVAHAAQAASLADWADLDGHLLVGEEPFQGLRFEDGRVLPPTGPGLGVSPA